MDMTFRRYAKAVKTCPHCGAKGPMEIVEGEKRFDRVWFWTLLCVTFGVGLLFVGLWYHTVPEAHCPGCGKTFPA